MRKPVLAIAWILALAACSQPWPASDPIPTPTAEPFAVQPAAPDPASLQRGDFLFRRGVRPLCHACHSLKGM